MMMESSSRIDWVLPNHELIRRLDRVWSGADWRDSLAETLDEIPEWAGWDSWERDRQVAELDRLLDQWERPDEVNAPQVEPLSEDTGQPRWNPGSEMWEVYNAARAEWWAHDPASGTWLDPVAQQWVPYQSGAADAQPGGGPYDWVPAAQAQVLTRRYGDGWTGELGAVLDARWGADWQANPAEHKQAWLTDLLPTLAGPEPAVKRELEVPDVDFEELDDDEDEDGDDVDGTDVDGTDVDPRN